MKALNVYLSCILAAGAVTWWAVAPVGAEQQAAQIQQEVGRSLRGGDFERIEVSVVGSEVTLSGTVPHLLAKNEAIERALEVDGVETVASELQLPVEEEDADVAAEVIKAINRYATSRSGTTSTAASTKVPSHSAAVSPPRGTRNASSTRRSPRLGASRTMSTK